MTLDMKLVSKTASLGLLGLTLLSIPSVCDSGCVSMLSGEDSKKYNKDQEYLAQNLSSKDIQEYDIR